MYSIIIVYNILGALLWNPLLLVIPWYSWARAKTVFLIGKPRCTWYHNHSLHHDFYPVLHSLPLEKPLNTKESCGANLNFLPRIVYNIVHYNMMHNDLLSCGYTFPSSLYSLWCYVCCHVCLQLNNMIAIALHRLSWKTSLPPIYRLVDDHQRWNDTFVLRTWLFIF